jgi:hypothetical protein
MPVATRDFNAGWQAVYSARSAETASVRAVPAFQERYDEYARETPCVVADS